MKTADLMHVTLASFARAPEAIERATVTFVDVPCGACAARGTVADSFMGSEREIQCAQCMGKGSIACEVKP